ncbi:glycosyltransferase family 2 protein [Gillisia limnaea]|uniref:Glycosyl transferase family 2 n=1 Tax=Gillisia limnaea (strain DSM 15749 / LMG 21470 / R-8282) TaxID=865937 RepID=H2BT53_GILLR|nr:glycosyltransferase family 2 protein [Gillisia limnaea]EHQ02611.1 glycosyl transferase family 2 [Gillisia limnaea DSM 15749]
MKFSIITIVYNREKYISDCIESVLNQTYSNIEYLVIDGGSSDGTQRKIERYKDRIDYYSSEKDEGIYDALNKGIKNATGDIIGILHSDDLFFQVDTIRNIANAFESSNADLVYAKGLFVDKENPEKIKRIYPSKIFRKRFLLYGWIPLHTTIFVRREIFEKYGMYDPGYSIASDYEISLRWFKNEQIKKLFLNEWVVKMRLGGISTSVKLQIKKSREDLSIIKLYNLNGIFTLACKVGRKIPQYLIPQVLGSNRFI